MAFQKKSLLLKRLASAQYAYILDANQTGLDLNSDFTIEVAVSFVATNVHNDLVMKWDGTGNQRSWEFSYNGSTGELQMEVSSDGTSPGAAYAHVSWSPVANKKYHLAAVYDKAAGTCQFYVDGQAQGSLQTGLPTSIFNASSAVCIGTYNHVGGGTASENLGGSIMQVRVWSDKRTQQELQDNRFVLLVGNEANLVACWDLNGDYFDKTSNNNDLTAVNSPIFTPDVAYSTVNASDWSTSRKLFVPSSKGSGSGNLTDFPVVLKNTMIPAASFSAMQLGEAYTSWLMDDDAFKGYYRGESGALVTDSSGNSNTLTNNNSVALGTGIFGGCFDFGSANTNKYMSIASNLGIAGNVPMSVRLKVKLSTEITTGYYGIFNHTDAGASRYIQLYYDYNAGTRRLVLDNAGTTGTYTVSLGTTDWYDVVVVRNSSNQASLYINGVEVISNVAQGATGGGSTITSFGTGNSLAIFLSGLIDDVGFIAREISIEEIKGLYLGGADIRITTDSAGVTEVPFEIVNVAPGSSVAEIWLKIPTLYYNQNTDFYIWSGNNRAMPYQKKAFFGQYNVWSLNYKAVYHLQSNGEDATINANDLTVNGSPTFGAGAFGNGVTIDETTKYLEKSSGGIGLPSGVTDFTLSVMVKRIATLNSTPSGYPFIGIVTDGNNVAAIIPGSSADNIRGVIFGGGTPSYSTQTPLTLDTYHAYAFVVSASGVTYKTFKDASLITTDTVTARNFGSAVKLQIGNTYDLNSQVDEARVYADNLTDDWVITEQTMFGDPTTFILSTVTTAITSSLQYAVKTINAITKSDQYTVKRPISVTKSAQYTIYRTIAAITKGLIYSIVPDNVITKALEYMILRSIGITKSMAYAIILEQIVTKSMVYAVLNEQAITKSMAYSIFLQTSLTKSLDYKILSDVLIQKSMQYHVGTEGYIYNYTPRGNEYTDQYQ